ncbi:hypothetical protein BDV18DRAFT_45916 [Aspergillus unguis]
MALDSSAHGPRRKVRYGGLQLRPLNVEKGADRFPIANNVLPPPTSSWRCNLTALSQRRNLLFVASGAKVHVWEPAGSSQSLGFQPEMIISPVMKEPGANGYIRARSPHEINAILVDDLGREEVLLLVTDSGNVCGYRVEAIFAALKRATAGAKPRPLDGSDVDPFFIEHVGQSAWGLAIHKFARLIAVSANTGLVTVFAFALVNPTSENGDDSFRELEDEGEFTEYSQTWLHIRNDKQFEQLQRLMPDKHRTRNIKLTYSGHFDNIPSVGFLNSDFDPNGTWMVSTDINDKTLVWKIWESLGPFNEYQLDTVAPRNTADVFLHDGDRGWFVIALDPRTFHWVESEEEACGGQPERRVKFKQEILDLTKLSKHLPDASRLYNHFPPAVKAEPEQATLPNIFGADCRISGSNHSEEKSEPGSRNVASMSPESSPDKFSHQAVDGSIYADEMSEDSASEADDSPQAQPAAGHNALLQALINSENNDLPLSPGHRLQLALLDAVGGNAHEVEALLGEDLSDLDYDEDVEHYVQRYEDSLDQYDSDDSSGEAYQILNPPPNADFPILHFSHTNICLIPHPFSTTASVVCGAPLFQRFAHPIVSISHADRFNMVKYIPEHGIVVAATQKGRAAIIALTESQETGRSFRVDWIVPLESQEKYGERPLVPLLGMSVAPMQGFEIPPDVPYIPHGEESDKDTDINDLTFQYKDVTMDINADGASSRPSSSSSHTSASSTSDNDLPQNRNQTLPESHARASCAYQPEESWRGWNASRRYRLLLVYMDHTVMSYEFWYAWGLDGRGKDGNGSGGDEDDILII